MRSFFPQEWCNTDPARRADSALCGAHYATVETDATTFTAYLCGINPAGDKCVTIGQPFTCELEPASPPSPASPPTNLCPMLASGVT